MTKPRTSTRDQRSVLDAFSAWLQREVGAAAAPRITSHGSPTGAGLSSDTVLLDLEWSTPTGPTARAVVLRLPPPDDAFPIFETYDLGRQVEAMRTVRAGCSAPVPDILWSDPTGAAIGVPFFVMERIDGLVPPDVMPYTWGSWVTELDVPQLVTMTDDATDALVAIHSVAPTDRLRAAARNDGSTAGPHATSVALHLAKVRRHFDWAAGDRHFPTIERGFAVLAATMPVIERDDVLSWGDARIGNILWNDARAVAILDWEMTTVGPRELDVAWLVYFAQSFQRSAESRGLPGLPPLLRRNDVLDRYQRMTDTTLVAFEWFLAVTGLHQSIIAIRTSDRAVAFGEAETSEDPEADLYPIPALADLLDIVEGG